MKAKKASMLFRNFSWLKRYFRKGHFWSLGKFIRSVGNVTAAYNAINPSKENYPYLLKSSNEEE